VGRKKIRPGKFLRSTFQLVKCLRVEPSQAQHDATGGSEPKVGEIQSLQIASEGDPSHFLAAANAKRVELTGDDGLEAGSRYGK